LREPNLPIRVGRRVPIVTGRGEIQQHKRVLKRTDLDITGEWYASIYSRVLSEETNLRGTEIERRETAEPNGVRGDRLGLGCGFFGVHDRELCKIGHC